MSAAPAALPAPLCMFCHAFPSVARSSAAAPAHNVVREMLKPEECKEFVRYPKLLAALGDQAEMAPVSARLFDRRICSTRLACSPPPSMAGLPTWSVPAMRWHSATIPLLPTRCPRSLWKFYPKHSILPELYSAVSDEFSMHAWLWNPSAKLHASQPPRTTWSWPPSSALLQPWITRNQSVTQFSASDSTCSLMT